MVMAEKTFNYLGWGARQAGKGCWLLDMGLGRRGQSLARTGMPKREDVSAERSLLDSLIEWDLLLWLEPTKQLESKTGR